MPRPAIPLSAIDPDKLGPNSPLRQLVRRSKPARDLEHQQQCQFFAWCAEQESAHPSLHWMFAVPNWFGVRTAKQGARAKREGRKPGIPDVWFPIPRGVYRGLVMEFKAGTNRPTHEQRLWLGILAANGWRAEVVYSAEDAKTIVLHYLSGSPTYA